MIVRKYKVLFSLRQMMGTFSEVVEVETGDDKELRKALNKRVKEEGLVVNGKPPRVRDILLVETINLDIAA